MSGGRWSRLEEKGVVGLANGDALVYSATIALEDVPDLCPSDACGLTLWRKEELRITKACDGVWQHETLDGRTKSQGCLTFGLSMYLSSVAYLVNGNCERVIMAVYSVEALLYMMIRPDLVKQLKVRITVSRKG